MEFETPFKYSVRVTTLNDAQSVTALLDNSYPVLMRSCYEEPALSAALSIICKANPSLLSSGTYYLAETQDSLVVGCGGWTREEPGEGSIVPKLGHIRHFATHSAWVGQGISRSIYLACEQQARESGITQFECYSTLNAEGFYAALGFKPIKPIDVNLSNQVSLSGVLMRRSL
jgi:GNAT superfamily N-acetyltransferase